MSLRRPCRAEIHRRRVVQMTVVRDEAQQRTVATFTRAFSPDFNGTTVSRMIGAANFDTNELRYHGNIHRSFKFSLSQPGPVPLATEDPNLPPGLLAGPAQDPSAPPPGLTAATPSAGVPVPPPGANGPTAAAAAPVAARSAPANGGGSEADAVAPAGDAQPADTAAGEAPPLGPEATDSAVGSAAGRALLVGLAMGAALVV